MAWIVGKIGMIKNILVILIIVACAGGMPQAAIPSIEEKNISFSQDEESLRNCVSRFLTTWLVNRNAIAAFNSFGIKAFENKAIFDDECSGYIRDFDRNSVEAIKKGVEKFLKDTSSLTACNNLNDVLAIDSLVSLKKRLGAKVINSLIQDRFLLVRAKPGDVVSLTSRSKPRKFLQKYLKSTEPLYLSFISLGGGIMYFVWEKKSENWKICHASLICM
jgi:hypothetical protein